MLASHQTSKKLLFSSNAITSIVELQKPKIFLSIYRLTAIPSIELNEIAQSLTTKLKSLGVFGRVYVGKDGLNAQISIPNNKEKLDQLKEYFARSAYFSSVFLNESVEDGNLAFDKLQVKIRKQIVSDGMELGGSILSSSLVPKSLSPEEFHEALLNTPNLLNFDVRNSYEIAVGHFKNATIIQSETYSDYMKKYLNYLEKNNIPKDRPIFMHCTGGIRCSKSGMILRSLGYSNVNMLAGGITNYAKWIMQNGKESLFIGKNYTFDGRRGERITSDILTQCIKCSNSSDSYENCANSACDKSFTICVDCLQNALPTCSVECREIINNPFLHDVLKKKGTMPHQKSWEWKTQFSESTI